MKKTPKVFSKQRRMKRNWWTGEFQRLAVYATKDIMLGQQLLEEGLAQSVAATVASKEPKIKGACLEIANIVTDWRAGSRWYGDCFGPVGEVLYTATPTWVGHMDQYFQSNRQETKQFATMVLEDSAASWAGCVSLAALGWETGAMDMGLRVMK